MHTAHRPGLDSVTAHRLGLDSFAPSTNATAATEEGEDEDEDKEGIDVGCWAVCAEGTGRAMSMSFM